MFGTVENEAGGILGMVGGAAEALVRGAFGVLAATEETDETADVAIGVTVEALAGAGEAVEALAELGA